MWTTGGNKVEIQLVVVYKVSSGAPMKKATPKSGFFDQQRLLMGRLKRGLSSLAEHRDGDVNQHIGVQCNVDSVVASGFQWAVRQADLRFGYWKA